MNTELESKREMFRLNHEAWLNNPHTQFILRALDDVLPKALDIASLSTLATTGECQMRTALIEINTRKEIVKYVKNTEKLATTLISS